MWTVATEGSCTVCIYNNIHVCNKVLIQSLEGALVRVRVRFGVGVLERAKETLEALNGFLKLIHNCTFCRKIWRQMLAN